MKKFYLVFTVCLTVLCFFTFSSYGAIRKLPYLMSVTDSSVWVLAEFDNNDDVSVQYGLTTSYGMTKTTTQTAATSSGNYTNKTLLTNLQPDTAYYYLVSQAGTDWGPYRFRTPVSRGNSFKMAITADTRSGTGLGQWGTVGTGVNIFPAKIIQHSPRAWVNLGDITANTNYNPWRNEFLTDAMQMLCSESPLYFACGDYEMYGSITKAFMQTPAGTGTQQDSGYYYVDYGDLRLLVLNTIWLVENGNNTNYNRMKDYYTSVLADCDAQWIVAVSQHPSYSISKGYPPATNFPRAPYHDCDWDYYYQDLINEVFEPAGVDMCLGGQVHYYQDNLVNGIHHVSIPSTGAEAWSPSTYFDYNGTSYTIDTAYGKGYSILDVKPDTLRLITYIFRTSDSVMVPVDTITLAKPYAGTASFTSSGSETATVDEDFSYTITYQNGVSGTPSLTIISKPDWVTFHSSGDSLSGTPTEVGTDTVKVALLVDAVPYDTLELMITVEPSVGVKDPFKNVTGTLNLSVMPASAGKTDLLITTVESGGFSLEIYNIQGRKVWRHEVTSVDAGLHKVTWQSKRAGQSTNGIYFLAFKQGDVTAVKRFAVIK